jgi:riboflavin kinase/FMN adenylyltransferase
MMTSSGRQVSDVSMLAPSERIVTIGTFDGVHRGHQLLLARTAERARLLGLPSLVVTFEPIPAMVLRPDRFPGRIIPAAEKLERLSTAGLDHILTIPFDHALSRLSPEEFMNWLANATGLQELWVGEAFALGRNRVGNVDRLRAIGADVGFQVQVLPRLMDDGTLISSSAIRTAIQQGHVATAYRLLGRPYRIAGEVIHGAHLGRTIGYPTANVLPPEDLVQLADGIYVSCALLPGEIEMRRSMTYVGTRPTVNSGVRLVETHVLDFDGDLYGEIISVDVLEHIRGDATFNSLEELIAQLQRDESATRSYFAVRTRGAND